MVLDLFENFDFESGVGKLAHKNPDSRGYSLPKLLSYRGLWILPKKLPKN